MANAALEIKIAGPCVKSEHLALVNERLPHGIALTMQRAGAHLVLAGGWLRAIAAGTNDAGDIDIFVAAEAKATALADQLTAGSFVAVARTSRAITLRDDFSDETLQIIFARPFKSPQELIRQFDFANCAAAVWYERDWLSGEATLCSVCDEKFYESNDSRLLQYRGQGFGMPANSLKRVIKYVQRGYSISDGDLAHLVTDVWSSTPSRQRLEKSLAEVSTKIAKGGDYGEPSE